MKSVIGNGIPSLSVCDMSRFLTSLAVFILRIFPSSQIAYFEIGCAELPTSDTNGPCDNSITLSFKPSGVS